MIPINRDITAVAASAADVQYTRNAIFGLEHCRSTIDCLAPSDKLPFYCGQCTVGGDCPTAARSSNTCAIMPAHSDVGVVHPVAAASSVLGRDVVAFGRRVRGVAEPVVERPIDSASAEPLSSFGEAADGLNDPA